jgi:hypothetical protein
MRLFDILGFLDHFFQPHLFRFAILEKPVENVCISETYCFFLNIIEFPIPLDRDGLAYL